MFSLFLHSVKTTGHSITRLHLLLSLNASSSFSMRLSLFPAMRILEIYLVRKFLLADTFDQVVTFAAMSLFVYAESLAMVN